MNEFSENFSLCSHCEKQRQLCLSQDEKFVAIFLFYKTSQFLTGLPQQSEANYCGPMPRLSIKSFVGFNMARDEGR